MPRPKRPLKPRIIEPEPLHRGPSHVGHADDEEIVVEECEMVAPAIIARIKESLDHTPQLVGYPFMFALIAEGARPREVILKRAPRPLA